MPDLKRSIGYLYLQETKLERESPYSRPHPTISPGEPFKRYPQNPKVLLPRRWDGEITNFWDLLQKRRSHRNFSTDSITLTELSLLLWAAQGITAQVGHYYFRTAPSAGALYPIETYVLNVDVEGAEPGLYHFDVRGFQLELLREGRMEKELTGAALGQGMIRNAAAVFLWTAVLRRNMSKYGHRGVRYILLDAGHICQNLLLAAEALGLGACPVAAFFDDEVNGILQLDGQEETTLYMAVVGKKNRSGQ